MKPLTTKGLSRRHFLRGAGGVAMAIPFLEAMAPRRAEAGLVHPTRALFCYTPNGVIPADWFPDEDGTGYEMKPVMSALDKHRDNTVVLSGLSNYPADDQSSSGGAHFRGTASFLTAAWVQKDYVWNGQSIDQVIASEIGDATPFRSLQVGFGGSGGGGICGGTEYPCSYIRNISWSDAQTPLPNDTSVSNVFDRLFGGDAATENQRLKRLTYRQSILDLVMEDANGLQKRLGSSDKTRMDQYLTSVRELEQQIELLAAVECEAGEEPEVETYTDQIDAMQRLIALAFQCDLTRVITFMSYAGGASDNNLGAYTWVNDAKGQPLDSTFHNYSHHGDDPDAMAAVTAINAWEVGCLADMLDRLQESTEADGSNLLDATLVHWGKEYGDPADHDPMEMPIILGGKAGGQLQGGRHLACEKNTPLANLLISEAAMMGVPVDSFGDDGTEQLTGLL